MDGFAVRSADGLAPRRLRGTVYAGSTELPEVGPGEAVAVMTGGTVPAGADTVVPVEEARVDGVEGARRPLAETTPEPGRHVRPAGEMGARGRRILAAGRVLALPDLVAAAGCGADPLPVRPRPRVRVLSTGDEVVAWTTVPETHQVRDSNRLGAILQLERAGARVLGSGRVPDRPGELRAAVEAALEDADLVVTIGGVSMGEKDHLPGVFAALGVERLFHGVRVQPGKPVWGGHRQGCFVLGLPGNPVSSFVILELLAVPLIRALAGARVEARERPLEAGLAGAAARSRGRERYLPAALEVDGEGRVLVTPRPATGSGDWTSLAGAQALLRLPEHAVIAPGDPVRFLRLGA